ncbi:hypothetical protein [Rhizobium sp. BK176]|uniref:hypothetical protein n=1 Tax=Rhizobium sp. BK176 TaxID=2587071 RepID=UPI002169DBAB|nr:hypothetical protein [Rhizobium sp. BK176]MCS4089082.1 hypothetical protein [Rhizobium sp. BK176]
MKDVGTVVPLAKRMGPTMHLDIKRETRDFDRWLGYAEEEHKVLLAEIAALFEEHGPIPYNDYWIDAANDFKVGILDRALPGRRSQPHNWGFEEVDQWFSSRMRQHGKKFLLLGIIKDKGPEHLREMMEAYTPRAPAAIVAAAPAVP